jgi:ribonuclease BN (tRNA processing enzyme)
VKLRVLGSSGGWPAPARPCSGYLLEAAGQLILLDAGSGILVELLDHAELTALDAIWVSHLHPDHCADLPMIWHTLAYGGRRRAAPLPVFGPPGWPGALAGLLDEPDQLDAVFAVRELFGGATFPLGGLTLRAAAMRHGMDTYGVRVSSGRQTVSYTSDSAPCPAVVELARDADLFLAEAFLSTSDPPEFTSVSRPEDAARAATEGGAHRLVLTHLHPDADPVAAMDRARTEYSGPIQVAEPGRVFSI